MDQVKSSITGCETCCSEKISQANKVNKHKHTDVFNQPLRLSRLNAFYLLIYVQRKKP